jgi:hypothetical protein
VLDDKGLPALNVTARKYNKPKKSSNLGRFKALISVPIFVFHESKIYICHYAFDINRVEVGRYSIYEVRNQIVRRSEGRDEETQGRNCRLKGTA